MISTTFYKQSIFQSSKKNLCVFGVATYTFHPVEHPKPRHSLLRTEWLRAEGLLAWDFTRCTDCSSWLRRAKVLRIPRGKPGKKVTFDIF
jgi:hypothetical protein